MTPFVVRWANGNVHLIYADGFRVAPNGAYFWRWHDPYGDVWQHDCGFFPAGYQSIAPVVNVP